MPPSWCCIESRRWEQVMSESDVREQVRQRYAAAATAVRAESRGALVVVNGDSCCSAGSCAAESVAVDDTFGAALYSLDERDQLPAEAVAASLGCGNPTAVA